MPDENVPVPESSDVTAQPHELLPPPPPPAPEAPPVSPVSHVQTPLPPTGVVTEDERLWAAIAHISIIGTIFLAPLQFHWLLLLVPVAIAIWRKESNFIKFHCAQSAAYQLIVGAILFAITFLGVLLAIILVGFLIMGLAYLLGIAAAIYGVYAGAQVKSGKNFRYPIIADLVESFFNIRP